MSPAQKKERIYNDPVIKPFSLHGIFKPKWMVISTLVCIVLAIIISFEDLPSITIKESLFRLSIAVLYGIGLSPVFELTITDLIKVIR